MGPLSPPHHPPTLDDDLPSRIDQLDENVLSDSISSMFESEGQPITTQTGFRPQKVIYERPPCTGKTVRRDNRKLVALTLPKVVNYNMRSLFPKYENLAQDVHERESDLIFLTEVWEKKENKRHQFKLETLYEMKGIKYISTPRPGAQRGGGAAIAARLERFLLTKLNIVIPKSLEVVWGLLKPKVMKGKITTIIVCCFYSPPRSKKNNELIDHMTVTLQLLLNIHTNAGIIISGDRNDLGISALLSIDPSLRQTVSKVTHGFKTLDVIVTNLSCFFEEPVIVPAVLPDRPGHGVPSDHFGVIAKPRSNHSDLANNVKVKKMIRPLPESLIPTFTERFSSQDFQVLYGLSSSEMVDKFQSIIRPILSGTFPEKQITISSYDDPWFSEELRHLKRQRQRHYHRHGKDAKHTELMNKFNEKLKNAIQKYKLKIENDVRDGRRGSTYPALKRMGSRLFEANQPAFQLQNHTELNLTSAQFAEKIADHFP